MSAWHLKSSIVSPCQGSSIHPKILHAKFPAVVSSFHIVRNERWAFPSLWLHLQGAGNASFSPCPLKTWGWGVLPWGEETPDKLVAGSCWLQSVPREWAYVECAAMSLCSESGAWSRLPDRQTSPSLFRGNFMQVRVWFHQVRQHELFPDHICDDFWFWGCIFINRSICTDCLAKPS